MNANGDLLWKKAFVTGVWNQPKFDLTPQGTPFIVPGRWAAVDCTIDNKFLVIAVGTSGNVLWQRRYESLGSDESADVVATTDGGCLVVGSTDSFSARSKDIRLLRLDANGDIVWQHAYGGPDPDIACGVSTTADGGFLVTGSTRNTTPGEWDGFLLRLDGQGLLAGC